MRLKPSAYLILGMIRGQRSTGYEIKRAVDVSTRHFFSTSLAQIYPELARLEEAGYITGREEARGRRPRKVYAITAKGEAALDSWLRSRRVPDFEFRDEGLLRLFFADAIPRAEARALAQRLSEHALELERHVRDEILPIAEAARAEDSFRFPLEAARLGADFYRWRAEWFGRLADALAEETER